MNSNCIVSSNLQKAFHPMPDSCRTALMNAARSVQVQKRVKRTPARVLLIAVLLLLALIAVAYAATQLGLTDFFSRYYATSIPKAAQTALSSTEPKAYSVGPLKITLREMLADGRIIYATTDAMPADASTALLQMGNGDISDPLPASEAKRLKVAENITFQDAAHALQIPLYMVSSYLSVDDAYTSGDEMQDIVWDQDGSALLVDMITTKPNLVPDSLVVTLHLKVTEIDTSTEEYTAGPSWETTDMVTIPLSGVTAEKTYAPTGKFALDGFSLQKVVAQQTCAGIYLSTQLIASSSATQDDTDELLMHDIRITDAQGADFPIGMNLSASLNLDNWPTISYDSMIGSDDFPDVLQIKDAQSGSSVLLQ